MFASLALPIRSWQGQFLRWMPMIVSTMDYSEISVDCLTLISRPASFSAYTTFP